MQNTTLAVAGSSKGGSYPLTGSKDEAGVYINHMGTMSRRLTHVERQLAEDVRDDAVVQDAMLPMAEYSEGMIGTHKTSYPLAGSKDGRAYTNWHHRVIASEDSSRCLKGRATREMPDRPSKGASSRCYWGS